MGRELRKVPANWEHPKDDNGMYIPMFGEFYGDVLNEWLKSNDEWNNGTHPDLIENPDLKNEYPFFPMWEMLPDPEFFLKNKYKKEELTHIQLYENTSEGTPISPVFKIEDFDKLCLWAEENATTFANYTATKEEWKKMLSDGLVFATEDNFIFI